MAMNQVSPIITGFTRDDRLSDPFVRELYFGGPDSPGIISEAYRAAQKGYLDTPFQPKRVAGFSPFANRAMESVYSGIGGYKPFLDFQQDALLRSMDTIGDRKQLLDQALSGYRGAYGDLSSSFGQQGPAARDYLRASLTGFDPRSVSNFYNPFEEQVVQQTIDDVFKKGEIEDAAQRAADIKRGGESAFGSRARLTADERRAALGRGLGEVLGKIRSGGFQTAQDRALAESRFGRGRLADAAKFEQGLGSSLFGARRNISSDIRGVSGDLVGVWQKTMQNLVEMKDKNF
jgi:hypothetical protein